jgi:hypothetical protein
MKSHITSFVDHCRVPAEIGHPVQDPASWLRDDLVRDTSWIYRLNEQDVATLVAEAARVRKLIGDDPNSLLSIPAGSFDLGDFAPRMAQIREELINGRGAILLRGLPVNRLARIEVAIIYWMIGSELGIACSNNGDGDMIGHVTDVGKTQGDANSRGYQTSESMAFHCDQTSIVGLLCLRTPKSGGLSKICSSIALYNEMLRQDADSVHALAEPFYWTKHGETDGELFYTSPVFNVLDGVLCVSLGPTHIRKGHALPGAPAMSARQHKALDLAATIAEAQHVPMELQVGDIQLLNNGVILHTRTSYEDHPDPTMKRLLWRLWLTSKDVRPLTPYVMQWNQGVKLHSTSEHIRL